MITARQRSLVFLGHVLSFLRERVDSSLPLLGGEVFLQVVISGGQRPLRELVTHFGISSSTYNAINRLQDNYIQNRREVEGYGLVEIKPSPLDLRLKEVSLSQKGRDVAVALSDLILKYQPESTDANS